jgi:hypothetical protein
MLFRVSEAGIELHLGEANLRLNFVGPHGLLLFGDGRLAIGWGSLLRLRNWSISSSGTATNPTPEGRVGCSRRVGDIKGPKSTM